MSFVEEKVCMCLTIYLKDSETTLNEWFLSGITIASLHLFSSYACQILPAQIFIGG